LSSLDLSLARLVYINMDGLRNLPGSESTNLRPKSKVPLALVPKSKVPLALVPESKVPSDPSPYVSPHNHHFKAEYWRRGGLQVNTSR